MKKNFLLVMIMAIILGSSYKLSLATGESAIDNYINFDLMVKANKEAWFDFMKEKQDARMELLRKQHDAAYNNRIECLTQLKTGSPEEILAKHLVSTKKMIEKANAEWKNFSKIYGKKSKALWEKQEKATNGFFNKNLNPKKSIKKVKKIKQASPLEKPQIVPVKK